MTDVPADAAPTTVAPGDLAERLGMVSASPGVRTWAFLIDAMILVLLASPVLIGILIDVPVVSTVLIVVGIALPVVFGVVQLALHGRRGVTAGKASMRLRSVRVDDFTRPGFWRIVLRALVLGVSNVLPVIGPFVLLTSNLWDLGGTGDRPGRGRSVLDRVAGCWLLDVRAGLDPFDEAQLRRAHRALEEPLRDISEHLPSLATVAVAERPVLEERRSRAGIVGVSRQTWSERVDVAPPPVEAVADPSAPFLVFEDGSTVIVPSYGFIGRMPEAPPGRPADVLITLEDPQLLMSKTHLAFGVEAGTVWLLDQGSSNGTALVAADGTDSLLPSGTRVAVAHGAVVRVGSRMFQVRYGGLGA